MADSESDQRSYGLLSMSFYSSEDEETQDPIPLPWHTVLTEYECYFEGLSDESKAELLLDLAKNYYFYSTINWFNWGTNQEISGQFGEELQEIVDAFNTMPDRDPEDVTGYLAFHWSGIVWRAFYTPVVDDDDLDSVVVDISEGEAMELARSFVTVGFRDITNLL